MILTAYSHFKEFEIDIIFEKKEIVTENFQNKETGSSNIEFKGIKLELELSVKEELGIRDGGCELLIQAELNVLEGLEVGDTLKIENKKYKIEKSEPLDYSDCHCFVCKEDIHG